jgi:hypothetical protein
VSPTPTAADIIPAGVAGAQPMRGGPGGCPPSLSSFWGGAGVLPRSKPAMPSKHGSTLTGSSPRRAIPGVHRCEPAQAAQTTPAGVAGAQPMRGGPGVCPPSLLPLSGGAGVLPRSKPAKSSKLGNTLTACSPRRAIPGIHRCEPAQAAQTTPAGVAGAQPMRGGPGGAPPRLSLCGAGAEQRASDAQQTWRGHGDERNAQDVAMKECPQDA